MPRLPLTSDSASIFQVSRKRSTSASVVLQPRLTRTAPRESAGSTPMAAKTLEACTLPDEQADPEDTAIPLRSKAIIAVSALTPGTANKVVLGRRGALAPKITACGVASLEAGLKPVAQGRHAGSVRQACGRGRRGAEAGNAGDVLGSRAQIALLAAAFDQRLGDMDVAAADQRAHALRAAELMGGDGHEIGAQGLDAAIDAARAPAPRPHAAHRRRRARCRQFQRSAGSRRFRYWRA